MGVFVELSENEQKELWRLSRVYWREANRASDARAYLAACIMLGSTLETLLILMVNTYPEEALATRKYPTIRSDEPKAILDLTLAELLRVVKFAGWLPFSLGKHEEWNTKRAKVGDYAELSRMIRNFVHPARYATDYYRKRITKKIVDQQFEIVLACRDWLLSHVHQSLTNAMNDHEANASKARHEP